MTVFADGFTFKTGDGASPEVFTAMELLEIPEFMASGKATFPRRTTGDTDNTPRFGMGRDIPDELALVAELEYADAQQDRLRTVYGSGADVQLQFIMADGTVTVTYQAAFKVLSTPITATDPNGDGENNKQTFNVKRNSDWTETEV
jgi:hypothetical protein|tara:strand:- start:1827 stop:2264 length:438 start_codon:yes stop_codon:yes gene_type:complete